MRLTLIMTVAIIVVRTALADAGTASVEAQHKFNDVLTQLRVRDIVARVAPEISPRHKKVSELEREGLGPGFSRELFWVRIGVDEEWPTVLGGAQYLLERDRWNTLIAALRALEPSVVSQLSDALRLLLQNEMWAAFDQIYLEGIDPRNSASIDRERSLLLLQELARRIRYLGMSREQVDRISDREDSLRSILYECPDAKIYEAYRLPLPTIHEAANRHRSISHAYIVLGSQSAESNGDLLLAIRNRNGWRPPPGIRVYLVEDMVAVTVDGSFMPTSIAKTIRNYAKVGSEAKYSMRLPLNVGGELKYRAADPELEGWGELNLPNVPPGIGVGLRVNWVQTCVVCHGDADARFRSFVSGPEIPDDLFRIVVPRTEREVVTSRSWSEKTSSAEWKALVQLMTADYRVQGTPVATSNVRVTSKVGSKDSWVRERWRDMSLVAIGIGLIVFWGVMSWQARLNR